jgi:methylated-DNA-[protein]-cysteine S-methyltransferase
LVCARGAGSAANVQAIQAHVRDNPVMARSTRAARRPAAAPAEPIAPAVVAAFGSPIGPVHAAAVADAIIGLAVLSTEEGFTAGLARRTGRTSVRRDGAAEAGAVALLALVEEAVVVFLEARPWESPGDPLALLPVRLEGLSAWDRRVLDGVRTIGFGEVAGYGEVARRIGAPGAARAVGSAVGRNPVGLLIPCHRVIAGDGTLGGYGGAWPGDREALLALKERLLALEGVHVPRRQGRY